LFALRPTARIIAPEFVRPFRMSGKNDLDEAAAICAAVRQPQLRFVTVKSVEQQARLVVHRLRQGWQEKRTESLDRLRGLLAEFGQIIETKSCCTCSLNLRHGFDVFDLARWGRNGKAIFTQTLQVKFDGLSNLRLRLCDSRARGHATREVGNIG
jgi:hypothetical protein